MSRVSLVEIAATRVLGSRCSRAGFRNIGLAPDGARDRGRLSKREQFRFLTGAIVLRRWPSGNLLVDVIGNS